MKRKKVIILLEEHEDIDPDGINLLKENNYELFYPKNAQEIINNSTLNSSDAILVRGANINQKLIESMPELKIIARSGVGVDNIDIKAAEDNNVYVCNVPDANFTSVAEHVIGMLISLSHKIINGDRAIRKGNFDARFKYIGSELSKKTIGIIGFGKIGQLVAQKCVYGLDMKVLAYDPYVIKTDLKGVKLVQTSDEIYEKSDFITLHLPYIPSLHHFINENTLNKIKNTAYIINCARGGLIDEIALAEAIKSKKIAGAGIDVFETEPPPTDHVLWNIDNVLATPHMGASTYESLNRMAIGAAKEIVSVLKKEEPINALNKIYMEKY